MSILPYYYTTFRSPAIPIIKMLYVCNIQFVFEFICTLLTLAIMAKMAESVITVVLILCFARFVAI